MKRICMICYIASGLILSGALFFEVFAQVPKNLDNYIETVRQQFEVPGISVAIVKDGQIVLANGYGIRKLGEPAQVDEQTLFGIASNTKAFTATALALLVEESKIGWDEPVRRYLPWFQLADPYITHELTVRDLLVHRSGLPLGAGDLLWWPPSTYHRKEIAERLQYVPLKTSFRSAYAYDNVLYIVAGELIEAVTGKSWEDFVTERILDKIGMTDSNVRQSLATVGGNVAIPHAALDGVVRPVNPFASDNTNPAGGINASARDMAKWMIVQLDSGRLSKDIRLFSPRTTRQLWGLVTPMPTGEPPPSLIAARSQFNGYALGFGLRDYRGRKIVSHTGGLPGYVSQVTLLPELKLGIVVLTNQEETFAFMAVTHHILDSYLKVSDTDWLAALKTENQKRKERQAKADQETIAKRDSTAGPSLPLQSYAGTYTDAWYGDIVIDSDEKGGLKLRFTKTPVLVGTMTHWHYDTFVVRWHDRELRADAFVTFSLNPDGTIEQAKMKAVSPATDFSFDFHDLLLKPGHPK